MVLEFLNLELKIEIAYFEVIFKDIRTELIELEKKIEIVEQMRSEILS